MHQKLMTVSVIVAPLALFRCAKPYYGYTKGEWDQLSKEEILSARSEYEQVLYDKDTMRHEDMINQRMGVSASGGY
jgi:hypothetical protein